MNKKDKILKRLAHDFNFVESLGHKVFGVFLQGSQNYGLDYEGSDIDTKCIVLPSFEDIILNRKPISTTLVLEDNSHIDLKDIRLMWECFKKQNINFLEILFTPYFIVEPAYSDIWSTLTICSEDIAHYNNYAAVNCIVGMILEKNAALCHPYPSLKDKIDKYGYDNKQLHHIIRCEEFLNRYIDGVPYGECLFPTRPSYLIDVKANYIYSLDEAKELAKAIVDRAKAKKQVYMETHEPELNENVFNVLQETLLEAIKRSLKEEIIK